MIQFLEIIQFIRILCISNLGQQTALQNKIQCLNIPVPARQAREFMTQMTYKYVNTIKNLQLKLLQKNKTQYGCFLISM